MSKRKLLFIGDGVAKTGFSAVLTNIIKNLTDEYEIHHLAINYRGDPHPYDWKIYPAQLGGDLWGFNRIKEFANTRFDAIFILNDVWVVHKYLEIIKTEMKSPPPILVYFPIDAQELNKGWFEHFDIVTKCVVYTQFAYDEVKNFYPGVVDIVPHGVDNTTFFKMDMSKEDVKKMLFPKKEDLINSFVVFSGQRNQPRKRLDISMEGFYLFCKDKPENVKIYMHCGLKDVGYDIIQLSERFDIHSRLIVTGNNLGPQNIPEEKLNVIYNGVDVGLNTSIGEGWALVNHEHAACGVPQIVADHSALHELYQDCGLLVPAKYRFTNTDTLTVGRVITPEDLAEKLNEIYYNKKLYEELSQKSFNKFSSKEFSWDYIVENHWKKLIEEAING